MTEQETRTLLNKIFSVYPGFIKKNTDKKQTVSVWNDAFKECSYEDVESAFSRYSSTGKYPPTIADIMGRMPAKNTAHDPFYGYGSQEALQEAMEQNRKAAARIHQHAVIVEEMEAGRNQI